MEVTNDEITSKQILAKIHMDIASARGTLATLTEEKEAFLIQREQEAVKRIESVVIASKEALDQIELNRESLQAFSNELASYALELVGFKKKLEQKSADFEVAQTNAHKDIQERLVLLDSENRRLKMLASKIKSDREMLDIRAEKLDEKEKHVESKQAALKYAFEELRNKQNI